MGRFRFVLGAAVGIAVGALLVPPTLAAAKDIMNVFITNGVGNPVPVTGNVGVSGPVAVVQAGEPVTLRLGDFCSEDGDAFVVPLGKRLVVEDARGRLTVGTGERHNVNLFVRPAEFPPNASPIGYALPQVLDAQELTVDTYVVGGPLRAYAGPGATVETRINCSPEEGGGLAFTLSGYLADAS